MPWLLIGLISVALASAAGAQDTPAPTPKERYDALLGEYKAAELAWNQRYGNGDRGDPQAQIIARYRDWPAWDYAPRFVQFVEAYPEDPSAREALLWLADLPRQVGAGDARLQDPLRRLFELMARPRFRDDPGLIEGFKWAFRYPSPWTETYLRAILHDSPNRKVRGLACLSLADLLERRRQSAVDPLSDRDGLSPFEAFLRQRLAPEFIAYLKSTDLGAVERESRELLERTARDYGDVSLTPPGPNVLGKTLAELAKRGMGDLDRPDRGRPAPELTGPDASGRPLKLGDHRGKVVLLAFFADWDEASRKQYATLHRLTETHRGQPFVLLGVACDQDPERFRRAAAGSEITWPCWRDDGINGPIATSWGVDRLPTFFVIDPSGRIVDLHRGVGDEYLERSVERNVRRVGVR